MISVDITRYFDIMYRRIPAFGILFVILVLPVDINVIVISWDDILIVNGEHTCLRGGTAAVNLGSIPA